VITSSQDWTTDLVILSHSAAHLPRESAEVTNASRSLGLFNELFKIFYSVGG